MFFDSDSLLPAVESLMAQVVRGTDPAAKIAIEHLGTGGKRLRARLALEMVGRLGQAPEQGVAWAAACELLHNATLVHDDLQDGDEVRRGSPAAWVTHGAAQAINAGDLLWMAPLQAIEHAEVEPSTKWLLAKTIGRYGDQVVRGQATEWTMSERFDATWDNYLKAIRGKTSALFELPVVGGAFLAGLDSKQADTLADMFAEVGLLFQMQDDVLDLFGNKGRAELGADLYEGKLSALVAAHIEIYPGDREQLRAFLRAPREETRAEDVETWIAKFKQEGALETVCRRIVALAGLSIEPAVAKQFPGVVELRRELVELVLTPIAHVLDELELSGQE